MNEGPVLHIPHSSSVIPPGIRPAFSLSHVELQQELLAMTDGFTDELFNIPGATRISFSVSRLVMDPERFLNDALEVMAAQGMGVVYTHTSRGGRLRPTPSAEERAVLIERYYVPHHHAFTQAVDAVLARCPTCLIIDCHSFPSVALPYEDATCADRPAICLGTDTFHTPDWLVQAAGDAFQSAGLHVTVNHPFSGTFVPDKHYRKDPRVLSLMMEVNRGLYMEDLTGDVLPSFAGIWALLTRVVTALQKTSRIHGIL